MSTSSEKSGAEALKLTSGENTREARGWERLLPVFIRRTPDGVHVTVYWRRLLLSLTALTVVGWFALTAAAWGYVYFHRGVKSVNYTHLALPWRWHEYRVLRGAQYIARAKELLASEQWRGAILNLRVGLEKDPAHAEGRVLLAQFYTRLRRFDLAEETLLAGLPHRRGDDAYLQTVFQLLLQLQNDARVIALAAEIRAEPAGSTERKRLAALYAATAHAYRGRYDRAEELLSAHALSHTREGRLLEARLDWERDYPALALLKLEQLRKELPADDEIAARLAGYLRESGRTEEARRLNLLRQIARPAAPSPRLELRHLLIDAGEDAGAQREADEFFRDFARDDVALTLLAEQAANTGDAALARRVYDHCRGTGLAWEAPALLTVEAAVVAGRHQDALDLARERLRENPEWARRYYALFNGLQAIALHGLGDRDAARLFLKNFLGQANLRSEQLVATAGRLAGVGAPDDARELLARAAEDDPLNQAALTKLIELDLQAGRVAGLPAAAQKLLTMRKPSPELLASIRRELGRDRWLFLEGRTAALAALSVANRKN
jgi:hypothetical protein